MRRPRIDNAVRIVALVRETIETEVLKWRKLDERRQNDAGEKLYRVLRAGYPEGELPPLTDVDHVVLGETVTYWPGQTYQQANEIILNAAWELATIEIGDLMARRKPLPENMRRPRKPHYRRKKDVG